MTRIQRTILPVLLCATLFLFQASFVEAAEPDYHLYIEHDPKSILHIISIRPDKTEVRRGESFTLKVDGFILEEVTLSHLLLAKYWVVKDQKQSGELDIRTPLTETLHKGKYAFEATATLWEYLPSWFGYEFQFTLVDTQNRNISSITVTWPGMRDYIKTEEL